MSSVERFGYRVRRVAYRAMPRPVRLRARAAINGVWPASAEQAVLISYPKSGRTWLRTMLCVALAREHDLPVEDPTDLLRLTRYNRRLPTISVTHDDRPHQKPADEIETDKGAYAGLQVVFLARDPRDVVISSYFEATRRKGTFVGDLRAFLTAEVDGFESIITFYNAWAAARHVPRGFLLVRYEDLHRDPASEVTRVLDFVGAPVSAASVASAVDFGSFDHMRELEATGQVEGSDRLRPGDAGDADSFKTRRGIVGGFADYLSPAELERLTTTMQERLDPMYGYPLEP